jgi:tRNA threonylcarbamoyladenosine biosynthesis protein TsaB
MILLIDCATDDCSVAIASDNEIVAEQVAPSTLMHTSMLTVLIEKILEEQKIHTTDLKAVACGLGPGSYTGLRVGLSTSKAICYSLDIPLIGISTLAGMARYFSEREKDDHILVPMIDARRKEVYYGVFDSNGNRLKEDASLIISGESLGAMEAAYGKCAYIGPGAHKVDTSDASLKSRVLSFPSRASQLKEAALKKFNMASFSDLAYTEPLYLKPPNITKSKKTLF